VPTPSQTAGPFLSIGMQWCAVGSTVPVSDDAVTVTGRLLDGSGAPVTDAVLEFWQADANGHFPPKTATGWSGFTRALTDGDGTYVLRTVKPGRVAVTSGALQAPHIDVSIFARGLLQRLVTRIYFADETTANAEDPLLASIGDAALATTLVADSRPDGYHLDVRLQGDGETVFFVP
jgi:protocatechuate 3,4-dioxygenase alpha subunit